MKNIVLVGMMGVGKSAVGRMLAKELEMEFIDTDAQIEALVGMPIRDICKKHGIIRFHSEEELVISKLKDSSNLVIATGEGTIMNDKNYTILTHNSIIIFLNAAAETIYTRICRKNNRSLLPKGATLDTVRELIANNYYLYSSRSHYEVVVDKQDLDAVVAEIITYYKAHLSS